jgi:23S rRNA G2445 N2-methylase RlmL
MDFFATAAKGTEGALRDELRELHFGGVRADRGGVHFVGTWDEGFRACLLSRIAVRVLMPLSRFPAKDARSLYAGVRAIDWTPFLSSKQTLAVRATGQADALNHTQFVAQKTKDAVVDQIRDRSGARPSVSLEGADVEIFVHLAKGEATVYLDCAGDSLHKRGYRTRIGEAPLKEPLAASMLRLSGWDRTSPLVDPMCGSGTIVLEAALWARNIAPGIWRERFGIERWALHDDTRRLRVREIRDEARAAERSHAPDILGSDIDATILDAARANAKAARVNVTFNYGDVRALASSLERGFVVTNPPYGERLEGGESFYQDMAKALRGRKGSTVAVLTGTPEIEKAMKLKPSKWVILFNGPIECRFFVYEMGLPATGGETPKAKPRRR